MIFPLGFPLFLFRCCFPLVLAFVYMRLSLRLMSQALDIGAALGVVRQRVKAAASKAQAKGLSNSVRLVAVSKTKPLSLLLEAYKHGQRVFGENYVQELVDKASHPELPSDLTFHFIGHLQSNKANAVAALPNVTMVETVDKIKLANQLDKAVAKTQREKPLQVMVQINTSEEENKHGASPAEAADVVAHIQKECKNLEFVGVMTIGQLGRVVGPGEENPDFKKLVLCRQQICEKLSLDPANVELSMGMSGDFEHAIELGSTNVRVGSTIFGAREKK
eukprot:m.96031 g.96031  ORF g.96031 m.96031 type:complete len:277 (-) comp21959_c1_seq1:158-988(-)